MMRRLTSAILIVGMTLAALGLASARGHLPVAGIITICSGMGTQLIAVDSQGNPVERPHLCPDGLSALAGLAVPVAMAAVHSRAVGERQPPAPALAVLEMAAPRAHARGPPASV